MSKDLCLLRKALGVLRGKVSQTEGTADARALRWVFGLEMARTAVTGTAHEVLPVSKGHMCRLKPWKGKAQVPGWLCHQLAV